LQASSARERVATGGRSGCSPASWSLFTEMYGLPLTVYLLSGWLGNDVLGLDLTHDGGHLWSQLIGWNGDPHLSPFHLASYVVIGGGFVLMAAAWPVLFAAQQEGEVASAGPYEYVRHPQYAGFFLIMLGFLLQWPTLPTLFTFPVLLAVYRRLAIAEEAEVRGRLGEAYDAYAAVTPRFVPRWNRGTRHSASGLPVVVSGAAETTVLHVGGLHYATENSVVERALGARRGVTSVEANPVAQTATVTFDPGVTSVRELRRWVEDCGYHCADQSVPGHICDPLFDADERQQRPSPERAAAAHGHGRHAGMSMDAMVRDMRRRFLVALVFTVQIILWSDVGKSSFGSPLATPFGMGREVFELLLSLPVVLYASSIFFIGGVAALRARTLDMMVLVAVAIGAGWTYSVAATFFIEGDVFYEAAAMLATFVLLGHPFNPNWSS